MSTIREEPFDDDGVTGQEPPEDIVISPPDAPRVADDFGTTAGEQRRGDSLDRRIAREEPDVLDAAADDAPLYEREDAGRLVGTDLDVDTLDKTADQVASTTDDDAGLSAEEAAVRLIEE